ncbi:hypothetical protein LSAT2_007523, partial [Lamellibrachia satsuma]
FSECEDYVDCEWCESDKDRPKTSPCYGRGMCPTPSASSTRFRPTYIVAAAVAAVIFVAIMIVACIVCLRSTVTSLGPRGDEYDNAVPKPTASEGRPASATEHSPEGDYEELGSIGYDDTATGYDDITE